MEFDVTLSVFSIMQSDCLSQFFLVGIRVNCAFVGTIPYRTDRNMWRVQEALVSKWLFSEMIWRTNSQS
jgi:hypothetical protein